MPREIPVFVVLPPRTMLLDLAGPLEVLRRANYEQDKVHFTVRYLGSSCVLPTSIGLALTGVEPLPPTLPQNAVLLIVGNVEQPSEWERQASVRPQAEGEQQIVDWLAGSAKPQHQIIAICSGALLLARAGLLAGRSCTTHHADCEALSRLAPDARVLMNRLYVQDGNICSSAGVTAGVDLMLHLVQELAGLECAIAIARYLVVYLRRAGSDPQLSPWLEGRNHIHPSIHRVQDAIAKDPAASWTKAEVARVAGASERHLSRLFQEHVGMSMLEYRNRLRVALARELITQSNLDMERVAERAGFDSTRQLRRAWSRLYPTSPRQARA